MTTDTLAIDPGKATGWAYGVDTQLTGCGLFDPDQTSLVIPARITQIIVELPCWQKGDKPERINDLYITAFRAGLACAELRAVEQKLRIVRPRDWKGSVPKDVHNERVLKALTTEERAIVFAACDAGGKKVSVAKLNNVIDAVGLFLFQVGRRV